MDCCSVEHILEGGRGIIWLKRSAGVHDQFHFVAQIVDRSTTIYLVVLGGGVELVVVVFLSVIYCASSRFIYSFPAGCCC